MSSSASTRYTGGPSGAEVTLLVAIDGGAFLLAVAAFALTRRRRSRTRPPTAPPTAPADPDAAGPGTN